DLARRPRPLLDGQHVRFPDRARGSPALPHLPVPLPEVLAQDGGRAAPPRSRRAQARARPRARRAQRRRDRFGGGAPRRGAALHRRPRRAARRRQGARLPMTGVPHRRRDDARLSRDLKLFHVYRFLSTSYLFLPVLITFFVGRGLDFLHIALLNSVYALTA